MERRRSGKQAGDAGATPNGGATTGHEAELWAMADALRGSMDAAEYNHVVLGLIFLKYISDAFEDRREAVLAQWGEDAAEDPRRVHRRQCLLGTDRSSPDASSGEGEAPNRRPNHPSGDGRDRARQPDAQGRAAA